MFQNHGNVQDTLEFHWGKHHRGYVTNLNNQIKDKPLDSKSLDEVSRTKAVQRCKSKHTG